MVLLSIILVLLLRTISLGIRLSSHSNVTISPSSAKHPPLSPLLSIITLSALSKKCQGERVRSCLIAWHPPGTSQGFATVVICVPHPTPKGEQGRAAAGPRPSPPA